jgi:hypothetical protein
MEQALKNIYEGDDWNGNEKNDSNPDTMKRY